MQGKNNVLLWYIMFVMCFCLWSYNLWRDRNMYIIIILLLIFFIILYYIFLLVLLLLFLWQTKLSCLVCIMVSWSQHLRLRCVENARCDVWCSWRSRRKNSVRLCVVSSSTSSPSVTSQTGLIPASAVLMHSDLPYSHQWQPTSSVTSCIQLRSHTVFHFWCWLINTSSWNSVHTCALLAFMHFVVWYWLKDGNALQLVS